MAMLSLLSRRVGITTPMIFLAPDEDLARRGDQIGTSFAGAGFR